MELELTIDIPERRLTMHDHDLGGAEVGSIEKRGFVWLASVGQDNPATTWEQTYDEFHHAAAAMCIELTRRDNAKEKQNG